MFRKFAEVLGLKQGQDEVEVTEVINMYDAMLVHSAWKKRLNEYLEGRSNENLQPANIRVDNLCVLGKWIHNGGKTRFGHHPEYAKLVEEHAKFHEHAAQVVLAHQLGDTRLAQEILKGSFEEQSRRTVTCLTRLNAVLEEHNDNQTSH